MTLSASQRDQIRTMWWEGITSPRISKEMGITRNTVMGVVCREKLQRSPNAPPPSRRGGGNNRKDRPQPSALMHGNVLPLLDYKHVLRRAEPILACATCKWPVGNDLLADGFFCDAQVTRGSYCEHHATIAYNNPLNYRRNGG